MKALTIASLSALAFAGVACSESNQTAEVEPETAIAETTPVSATEQDGGFNLDLFEDDAGDDGFNIGFEDDTSDPLTGFDFGDDSGSGLLDDIPVIEAPVVLEDEEELVQLLDLPAPADEDELIRLPE